VEHGLISEEKIEDEEGYSYPGYKFTESGWAWILANKSEFVLKKPQRPSTFDDGGIPF